MFAVSKKRGTVIAVLTSVVLLVGGCGKAQSGDDPISVDDAGSSSTEDGAGQPDVKTDDKTGDVRVNGDGGSITVDGDKVEIKGDGVHIKIDGRGKVSAPDGGPVNMPKDFDMCSNIVGKQQTMPKGYMPGAGSTGNFTKGMFVCVKHPSAPGVNSDAMRKHIIDEMNKSLRESGVNVTVK